jgi:hypothetical protein
MITLLDHDTIALAADLRATLRCYGARPHGKLEVEVHDARLGDIVLGLDNEVVTVRRRVTASFPVEQVIG